MILLPYGDELREYLSKALPFSRPIIESQPKVTFERRPEKQFAVTGQPVEDMELVYKVKPVNYNRTFGYVIVGDFAFLLLTHSVGYEDRLISRNHVYIGETDAFKRKIESLQSQNMLRRMKSRKEIESLIEKMRDSTNYVNYPENYTNSQWHVSDEIIINKWMSLNINISEPQANVIDSLQGLSPDDFEEYTVPKSFYKFLRLPNEKVVQWNDANSKNYKDKNIKVYHDTLSEYRLNLIGIDYEAFLRSFK